VAKILFVTGTDTGAGKTLVTASLLHHLRAQGIRALAMKPFCSGPRADVHLLQRIQGSEISDAEANPFHFAAPVAPLVGARIEGRRISVDQVVERITKLAKQCYWLLVEGAGGLLSPLGPDFSALDLICRLRCEVCVVAPNKLGVLNHVLLTVRALPRTVQRECRVVLTNISRKPDPSAQTNAAVLNELLAPVAVFPYLGPRASTVGSIRRNYSKTRPVLDLVVNARAIN